MKKVTIIDGYIDEPTCLGVPPYISPYPRYIAGAIWHFDTSCNIFYVTIDQIRNNIKLIDDISKSDIIVVIAGISVPGRYLSGFPASPNELVNLLKKIDKPTRILCGPAARYGFGMTGGKKTREIENIENVFDIIIKGDPEIVIHRYLENKLKNDNINFSECRKNAESIRKYAITGSNIVNQHPYFPDYLIAEIETYRGCPRSIVGGCSFCSEPSKGLPDFRPVEDIIVEIQNLYKNGIRHFRIGNQPCIFSYMAEEAGKKEFPKPNPKAINNLFKGIRNAAPNLKTLHIDNANPGVIARYPDESKIIAKTIIKYHTSGDVAAFGIESVDPVVIKKNNLKATEEQSLKAIQVLNEVGSKIGSNGLPELLPGLNFVFGLEGETKKTFDLNYCFLKNILDKDLLIRRINLRQIIPIPGTKMYEYGNKIALKHKKYFQSFKRKIKNDIEQPMLKKVVFFGTVLKDVYTEKHDGKLTFSRQLGSYPLLVGIPGVHKLKNFIDVKVVDYGFRSVTALPYPVDINSVSSDVIEALPGVGKKRAMRIMKNRPFKNKTEFIGCFDEDFVGQNIIDWVVFN